MSNITGLDHIAIATDNLEESLNFFKKNLGLSCQKIETLEKRGIKVAFLPVGSTKIELIEPLHNKSEISIFLKKRGPGLHHIALNTTDLEANLEQLKNKNVQLVDQNSTSGANNTQIGFVHPKSTKGVLVELVEKKL